MARKILNRSFNRFWLRAIRFLILLLVLDQSVGTLLHYLYFSQTSGKYYRITQGLLETEADVLLAGTSHAVRHFVPRVFADGLNKTVYNIGARGQSVYYSVAVTEAIFDRHTPELIVLNIDSDMFRSPGNYDKLSDLKPYYRDVAALRKHIEKRGSLEKYKLFSRLYEFNSTLIHIVRYLAVPQEDHDGYLPMFKQSDSKYLSNEQKLITPEIPVAADQLVLLESMFRMVQNRGSKVVLVISPILAGDYIHSVAVGALAKKYNIPVLNYSLDERLVRKPELFGDQSHLNNQGALILSQDITHRIAQMKLLGQ